MKGLKKGIAIALAAATAFTFAPVSLLGLPVVSEAAALNTVTGITVTPGNPATMTSSANQVYRANSSSSGDYVLTASAEAWQALNVTYSINGGASQTASDSKRFTISNGQTFTPTFTDNNKGLNGTYTFTLTYVGTGTVNTGIDEVSYTVTLRNSTMTGLTAARLNTVRKSDNTTVSATTDQMGANAYYELAKDGVYTVTFNAPVYKPNNNSADLLNSANTNLSFSLEGNSVTYAPVASSSATPNQVTLTAVQPGKTTIKAVWTAKTAISGYAAGDTIDSVTFTVNVPDTANEPKVTYQVDGKDVTAVASNSTTTNAAIALDTIVNKTEKINVSNTTAAPSFVSDTTSVATVDASGNVTAVSRGTATIIVYVGDRNYRIPVNVSDVATDRITAQVNGADVNDTDKKIDLDIASSTASTAVKVAKVNFSSQNGLTASIALYTSELSATPVAGNANSILSVSSDGTLTAGNVAGDVYLKITTATDANRKITGATKWVKVTVNSTPQAQLTLNTTEIRLDTTTKKTMDLSTIVSTNATGVTPQYSMTASNSTENKDVATISGHTITANQIGVGTLNVTIPATATTRATTKSVKVNVQQQITKAASDLKILTPTVITLQPGGVSKITASTTASGSSITYVSSDPTKATVDAYGNVVGVAEGYSQITVNASATDLVDAGSATVTVIVQKPEQPQVVVNPVKVTGVKVTNVKGSKVRVTWNSQGKNILYRVYKKVGNAKKWTGKNVTSAKTTLSVKKGAKVQIKVKAFYKDDNGKTHWGPAATKAPTFTTDRK